VELKVHSIPGLHVALLPTVTVIILYYMYHNKMTLSKRALAGDSFNTIGRLLQGINCFISVSEGVLSKKWKASSAECWVSTYVYTLSSLSTYLLEIRLGLPELHLCLWWRYDTLAEMISEIIYVVGLQSANSIIVHGRGF